MSQDIQQQTNVGSSIGGYMAFPAFNAACIGVSALKNGKGIKGAVKNMNIDGYKAINNTLKNSGVDVFSRSEALSRGHETYKNLIKTDVKLNKKLAKIDKKGLPLKEKIKNLFRKDKLSVEDFKKMHTETSVKNAIDLESAQNAINKAGSNFNAKTAEALDDALKIDGKNFTKIAKEGAETVTKTGLKSSLKGFGKTVKGNFKRELSWKHGKFNIIMTALSFIPNVVKDVIPTFKNEGFKAGLKATGKTLVKAGTDLVSYAAGGAVGRAIGAAIGTVICPGAGSAVGATIGDVVGSMVVGGTVTNKMEKALDGDKKAEENTQEAPAVVAQEGSDINQVEATTSPIIPNNTQGQNLDITENSNLSQTYPKNYKEAKADMLGQNIEEKQTSRYIKPKNGVYHTSWVNELNKQRMEQQAAQLAAQQQTAQQQGVDLQA